MPRPAYMAPPVEGHRITFSSMEESMMWYQSNGSTWHTARGAQSTNKTYNTAVESTRTTFFSARKKVVPT